VFEINFVVGAGGKKADSGIIFIAGSYRCEPGAEGLKIVGEALDPEGAIFFAEDTIGDEAVAQSVSGASGGLGTVADDPPSSGGASGQIDAVEMEVTVASGFVAVGSAEEIRVSPDEFRRDPSLAQQAHGTMDIFEDEVEEKGPLAQSLAEFVPVLAGKDEGKNIHVPGSLNSLGVAVVDVGDAAFFDGLAGAVGASGEFLGTEFFQEVEDFLVMGPDLPSVIDGFIPGAGVGFVFGHEPGLEGLGRVLGLGLGLGRGGWVWGVEHRITRGIYHGHGSASGKQMGGRPNHGVIRQVMVLG
jgi:hypothetical protein